MFARGAEAKCTSKTFSRSNIGLQVWLMTSRQTVPDLRFQQRQQSAHKKDRSALYWGARQGTRSGTPRSSSGASGATGGGSSSVARSSTTTSSGRIRASEDLSDDLQALLDTSNEINFLQVQRGASTKTWSHGPDRRRRPPLPRRPLPLSATPRSRPVYAPARPPAGQEA